MAAAAAAAAAQAAASVAAELRHASTANPVNGKPREQQQHALLQRRRHQQQHHCDVATAVRAVKTCASSTVNSRSHRSRRPAAFALRAAGGGGEPGPAATKTTGSPPSSTPASAPPAPAPAPAAAGAELAAASEAALAAAVLDGEDAAAFSLEQQSLLSWVAFVAVFGVVMAILYVVWLSPDSGLGGPYAQFFQSLSDSPEVQMALMLLVFAVVHSGGAALRSRAEEVIGPRAYRVLFAGLSLPLAVSAVVFWINHRYDGTVLWQIRGVPFVHEACWILSFVSFFFLYPSTFNLLEVAAVDSPRVHLWETGIMRITRHPQMVGQLLWCIAHTAWIGSSFTATTSLILLLHHAFGCWHGDQRLSTKYGDTFDKVKARTSTIPFAAIIEGRQKLPADFYKEFLRMPYIAIVAMTLGAYLSHPLLLRAAFWLHW